MKKHVINRFIAITAVAWLGQASAETAPTNSHRAAPTATAQIDSSTNAAAHTFLDAQRSHKRN